MKKLSLNKELIANLSSQDMNGVKGLTGNTCAGDTCAASCVTCVTVQYESCVVCLMTDDDPTCTCA